jgi:hypothetical protein
MRGRKSMEDASEQTVEGNVLHKCQKLWRDYVNEGSHLRLRLREEWSWYSVFLGNVDDVAQP